MPIAYVDIDTLLTHYNYSIDANNALINMQNNSKATLARKQNELDVKVEEFRKNIENNAFLTQERAEQALAAIRKLETDLKLLTKKLQEDHTIEQQQVNSRIADSVKYALKEINKTSDYDIIFTNSGIDNILMAKDDYNITQKVVEFLNSRYKPENSK